MSEFRSFPCKCIDEWVAGEALFTASVCPATTRTTTQRDHHEGRFRPSYIEQSTQHEWIDFYISIVSLTSTTVAFLRSTFTMMGDIATRRTLWSSNHPLKSRNHSPTSNPRRLRAPACTPSTPVFSASPLHLLTTISLPSSDTSQPVRSPPSFPSTSLT